jgi:hypothetical protein
MSPINFPDVFVNFVKFSVSPRCVGNDRTLIIYGKQKRKFVQFVQCNDIVVISLA